MIQCLLFLCSPRFFARSPWARVAGSQQRARNSLLGYVCSAVANTVTTVVTLLATTLALAVTIAICCGAHAQLFLRLAAGAFQPLHVHQSVGLLQQSLLAHRIVATVRYCQRVREILLHLCGTAVPDGPRGQRPDGPRAVPVELYPSHSPHERARSGELEIHGRDADPYPNVHVQMQPQRHLGSGRPSPPIPIAFRSGELQVSRRCLPNSAHWVAPRLMTFRASRFAAEPAF